MKKYFEQLRPMERRLAVGVIVVLIAGGQLRSFGRILANWGNVESNIRQAQQTLKSYQDAIAQMPIFQQKLKKFQNEGEFVARQTRPLLF